MKFPSLFWYRNNALSRMRCHGIPLRVKQLENKLPGPKCVVANGHLSSKMFRWPKRLCLYSLLSSCCDYGIGHNVRVYHMQCRGTLRRSVWVLLRVLSGLTPLIQTVDEKRIVSLFSPNEVSTTFINGRKR